VQKSLDIKVGKPLDLWENDLGWPVFWWDSKVKIYLGVVYQRQGICGKILMCDGISVGNALFRAGGHIRPPTSCYVLPEHLRCDAFWTIRTPSLLRGLLTNL
jgi:hypothetical protein